MWFILDYIMWYLLVFFGIFFLIFGLDEIVFDFVYWWYYFKRKLKMRKYKPLSYDDLLKEPEKRIAILVACWQEHDVIGDMLRYNAPNIFYKNFDIFVAAYCNDPDTITVVEEVRKHFPNVHCAIGENPGPSNKAENLNTAYHYILDHEKEFGYHYEIFVMHDSEDIIHPFSLKLYNHLMPNKDMVQIPVFPLEVSLKEWIHWTYNDEFVQNHTKDMVVREAIHGFVPSAGVGTAFSRRALGVLEDDNEGRAFDQTTLTEDYGVSLRLNRLNLNAIFLVQQIKRVVPKRSWLLLGLKIQKEVTDYIVTRGLFPTNYSLAVRQKSRWIMGIAFQEWKVSGWKGGWQTKYMLFHDRQAVVSHIISGIAYFVFGYWLAKYLYALFYPDTITMAFYIEQQPWMNFVLYGCLFMMFNRWIQQVIASYRAYGFLPAFLCAPRIILANIINMHALFKAYRRFFISIKKPEKTKWAKTKNRFPSDKLLAKYKLRLGDLLIEKNLVTPKTLSKALKEQEMTGEKLGVILLKHHYVDKEKLMEALADEYQVDYREVSREDILSLEALPVMIGKENYEWLQDHQVYPIEYDEKTITLAVSNPAFGVHNEHADDIFAPRQVIYVICNIDE